MVTLKIVTNRFQGLLAIHLAVLLFGASGLFGKFLDLPAALIVYGRVFFASLAFAITIPIFKKNVRWQQRQDLIGFIFLGAVLAVHWTAFFYAIQISTVAIGLLTFSTFPVFVTFLEPLFFGERLRRFDVLISLVVFVGLVLVIPEFDLANNLTRGVIWGTISGLTFAVLSILNRKFVADYSAFTVSFYQNGVASLVLLPFVGRSIPDVTLPEWGQLVLLGVVFTAVAHTLFIKGMQTIKAQLASLIASLEPVYGILFALIFLQEVPSGRELLGGTIILSAIFYATRHANQPTNSN